MNNLSDNSFSVCGISKSKLVSSHIFAIQKYVSIAFGECVFTSVALLHNRVSYHLPDASVPPDSFYPQSKDSLKLKQSCFQ